MYLQKAILTEEENAIARLLGANEDTYLLDFAVDDTVNTLSIITYELVDGSWHSISSSGMQLKDTSGKIALTFDNIADGMRTAIQSEHTGSSDKYSTNPEYNFEGMSRTTSYLTNRTYVTYDNEIPLVIQIHTTQDVVSSSDINYFFKPQQYQKLGYEKVYAITAVFSQMPLNELENIDKHAGD